MVRCDKLANALACSIAMLEGTAGGYSPEEKMQAKLTLTTFQQNLLLEINHACNRKPDEISVSPALFIGVPEITETCKSCGHVHSGRCTETITDKRGSYTCNCPQTV